MSRGGKREGAGRPPAPPKVAITVKIKPKAVEKLNAHCAAKNTSQARAIEAWAMRLKT